MPKYLKLGVFLHGLFYTDGSRTFSRVPGDVFLDGLARFGIKFTNLCTSLKFCLQHTVKVLPTTVEERAIRLFPLPRWNDTAEIMRSLPFQWKMIGKTIRKFVLASDILWLRAPTPLMDMFLQEARRQRKPVVIHMAGNIRGMWRSSKHKGFGKILTYLGGIAFHRFYRQVLKNETLLATGAELMEFFSGYGRKVFHFVDSVVDFPKKKRIPEVMPSRLLFVGRLDHGKGLFTALQAIKEAQEAKIEAHLSIAGTGPISDILKTRAQDLSIDKLVTFHGFVPYGKKLEKVYNDNHILLLSSEATEGFPRVFLEAWSYGLGIIASNVGGVKDIIRTSENGILIPPNDSNAICNSIRALQNKPRLMQAIVQGGYESLRFYTRDVQLKLAAEVMWDIYKETCS